MDQESRWYSMFKRLDQNKNHPSVEKVLDGVGKVSYGIKKMSEGARKVSDGVRKCSEYILKDSWCAQSIF